MDDTFSPAPTLEAALTRTFGPREEFFRVLTHALRQRCGDTDCPGDVLLDIAAPLAPCGEEALALRVSVIDWRHCARRYEEVLAQKNETAP